MDNAPDSSESIISEIESTEGTELDSGSEFEYIAQDQEREHDIEQEDQINEKEEPEEKEETLSEFIANNTGGNEENLKLEYEGTVVLAGLTEEQKQAQAEMLTSLTANPDQSQMLPDYREGKTTYFTAVKMDREGNLKYEIRSLTEKEEEKPIGKIEGDKTVEEALNLEINLDIGKQETRDGEVVVDASLSVEAERSTEETVEQGQATIQEEVNLGVSEVSNLTTEATPTITAEREYAEPNVVPSIISSEKPSIHDSIQAIEQSPTQTTDKVDEQMTITEKILDLLKDEPVIENKTPDILEKPKEIKEDKEKIEMAEIQIPAEPEIIEQIQVVQEQIASIDIRVDEDIKAFLPETKTVSNTKIEATKPETIMQQPETKIVDLAESTDKGVISPYMELSTIFKDEIKNVEKEEIKKEVLVITSEKMAGDAVDTPDISVNTITETAKTEQGIYAKIKETSKEEQIVQVVQPEITEEIQTEQTIESALGSAVVKAEEQVEEVKANTATTEKAIVEVTVEVSTQIPATSSEIEIKNEVAEAIENVKIEKKSPTDGHEMLLRILGVPLTKIENRNESDQIRSMPYYAGEPESNTVKTTNIRPKTSDTLNGITLKRAA